MSGAKFILLDKVDSTNTYARTHFDSFDDCTIVAAREQSAGRGRLGRHWESGRDLAIMMSAVLKNVIQPFHAGIVTGLAGLELIRECVPQAFTYFKWPNDIYCDEFKVAGVLSEGVFAGGALRGVISGIGINVNNSTVGLRKNSVSAISLSEIAGTGFFLEKLRFELAKKIEKYYIICQSHFDDALALWRQENRLIGEKLVLDLPAGGSRCGVFTAIADSGAMLMQDENGEKFCFDCGDVKIDTSLIDFKSLKHKNQPNKQKGEAL